MGRILGPHAVLLALPARMANHFLDRNRGETFKLCTERTGDVRGKKHIDCVVERMPLGQHVGLGDLEVAPSDALHKRLLIDEGPRAVLMTVAPGRSRAIRSRSSGSRGRTSDR